MTIIISQALVLNPQTVPLNTPVFGWNNRITSVAASNENPSYPASNLINPSTALRWQVDGTISPSPSNTDVYLTVDTSLFGDVDYLAIAVHNLGTGQNSVSVEYLDTTLSPETWTELITQHILANNDPVLFRFTSTTYHSLRLRIQPSPLAVQTTPFIAVMHIGKLLVMPRGTHTDHTPINLGIQSNVMTGRSETGNFLGRVILSEQRATSIAFQRLTSDWYRTYMQPFIVAAKAHPFFFAWKPQEFPADVGYCWLASDTQPSRHFDTGTMAITLQMGGVAI